MKKLILFLILPLTLILAQTNEEEKPIDLTGKFALMFQVDENFDLNSFDGMSFAGKYFFDDNWGVRLRFGTSISKTDADGFRIDEYNNDDGFSRSIDRTSFKIHAGLIYTLVKSNNIRFFMGSGPFYEYNKEDDQQLNYSINNDDRYTANRLFTNRAYGVGLFSGIEWFVAANISLSAEYGFKYYLEQDKETLDRKFDSNGIVTYESKIEEEGTELQSLSIALGVSIYF